MDELAAIYDEHAKHCDETDFWGQVRRTENGQPVTEDQIELIVHQMIEALSLGPDDVLLDICCGNGALSDRFFDRCSGGVGVDYSETLVEIARKYFSRPSVTYEEGEAVEFLSGAEAPERFTKALVYGSFNYFPRAAAEQMLTALRKRFTGVDRLVIGNVADAAHLEAFFGDRYEPGIEERPDSAIGIWWSRPAFMALAQRAGWSAEFRRMPEAFYARHYRFDAVLRPT